MIERLSAASRKVAPRPFSRELQPGCLQRLVGQVKAKLPGVQRKCSAPLSFYEVSVVLSNSSWGAVRDIKMPSLSLYLPVVYNPDR